MPLVKTSAKGQIVIPASIRRRLGIAPGDRLYLYVENGALLMAPIPRDPIAALEGSLKGEPLLDELLEERRKERERDEATGSGLLSSDSLASGRSARRSRKRVVEGG